MTMVLGCVDNMDYVYGGAKNANVKGGVDLVVTSGHFNGVFGGNDTSGSIQGPITLTIEETGCAPLIIDNLYLGGNLAAYSVYGYKQVGDNLVARSSMTDGTAVNPPGREREQESALFRIPAGISSIRSPSMRKLAIPEENRSLIIVCSSRGTSVGKGEGQRYDAGTVFVDEVGLHAEILHPAAYLDGLPAVGVVSLSRVVVPEPDRRCP